MAHPQHDLDAYPVRLHLITRPRQWREHHAELPMHQDDPPDSAGLTASTLDRYGGMLHVTVWLDAKWHRKHDHDPVDTVIHEAVHAAGAILDHVQQGYDGQSEALAYLTEWIARWIRQSL